MPVPEGYYWIRELLPGVEWEEATRTIKLPGGPRIPLSATKVEEGRAYVTPAQLATWYATYRPQSQVTPEALKARAEVYRELFRPLWEASKEQFDFGLKKIREQAAAQRRLAEAAYEAARSALERKEASAWNAIMKSALTRGLGASPLASYEQRKVAETYAPEYRQLETQRAAQLANIASKAALAANELAQQGQEQQARWASQIAQYAYNALQSDTAEQRKAAELLADYFARLADREAKLRQEAARLEWEKEKAYIPYRYIKPAEQLEHFRWETEWPYRRAQMQQAQRSRQPSVTDVRNYIYGEYMSRLKKSLDDAWATGGWAAAVDLLPILEAEIYAEAPELRKAGVDPQLLIDYIYQTVGGFTKEGGKWVRAEMQTSQRPQL